MCILTDFNQVVIYAYLILFKFLMISSCSSFMQLSKAIVLVYFYVNVVNSKIDWIMFLDISGHKGSVALFFFLRHIFYLFIFFCI